MEHRTFSDIIRFNARTYPDKTFCIEYSSGEKINYNNFNAKINQCCHFLKEKGINKNDIISVALENHLIMIIIYFAALRLNAAVNPLPSSLSPEEIKKNCTFLQPKILFLEDIQAYKAYKTSYTVFYLDETRDQFFDLLETYDKEYDQKSISWHDVACYYYTSGTTSNPKCIMYSHKNMISLIRSMTISFRHSFDDIHLGFLPLGHTAITNYQLLPVIFNAGTLVLCENFMKIRPQFWKIINQHKITYVQMVPTLLYMMLNTPYSEEDIAANKSLKYVGCGSAPLSLDIQQKFNRKFTIPVVNLYGLSESGPSHFDDPFVKNWQPGSIGKPIYDCSCKIFREDKTEAGVDEIGEIGLKGDNIFTGYYKNENAYHAVMHQNYFLTGDFGYIDTNGIFYFVDRKKDLIIKGGVNIFPGEIEEVLYHLNAIELTAVIGIPHPIYGEDIVAFIKFKPGLSMSEKEIDDYCRQNLQPFKCPQQIIITDTIPLGPSKKILKRELRKIYLEDFHG